MNPFAPPDQFVAAIVPPASPAKSTEAVALWFAFLGDKLLVRTGAEGMTIPTAASLSDLGIQPKRSQFLGWLSDQPCYSAELRSATGLPEGYGLERLRELHGELEGGLFAIAARAIQIVAWDSNHQFCGQCATAMEPSPTERTKHCPNCGLRNYPKLSPAVIMLIYRGEEILLARSPRFRNGMYSVLAGFVEPGESLEEAVARETLEEVGITVKNIRYFGSQPWPFPDSLMLGFTAEYASGEIVMEPGEIEAADWFTKDNLPPVPGPLSIARKLIDAFVAGDIS